MMSGVPSGRGIIERLRKNVKFRFELQYQDGTMVGTMLSKGQIMIDAGEAAFVKLNLDTMHLAPGRYKADIIAYVDNEFGIEQFLDGVYPGFTFEISDELNENNQLMWLHQFWGHIHLHDVSVQKLGEESNGGE